MLKYLTCGYLDPPALESLGFRVLGFPEAPDRFMIDTWALNGLLLFMIEILREFTYQHISQPWEVWSVL